MDPAWIIDKSEAYEQACYTMLAVEEQQRLVTCGRAPRRSSGSPCPCIGPFCSGSWSRRRSYANSTTA